MLYTEELYIHFKPFSQNILQFIKNQYSFAFVNGYEEVIIQVSQTQDVFFNDSAIIDCFLQTKCNIIQIGNLLDLKRFSIVTQEESPWRDTITLSIKNIEKKGTILCLYNKWLKNATVICKRDDSDNKYKNTALEIRNIGNILL